MKQLAAGLQDSVVTTYGDTTKTFVTNLVKNKTINLKSVYGPPRNFFIPVFDDFAVAPVLMHMTPNNRLFVINAPVATGLCRVMLYDFNPETGQATAVGSLNMQILGGTQTVRALVVDDGPNPASLTGWKIFLLTTSSVAANGGLFMANSIAKTDFSLSPATIPTATTTDGKEVYKLENSPFTLTAGTGLGIDRTNFRVYERNGSATVYQIARFTYNVTTGAPGVGGVITSLTDFVTGNLPATVGTLIQNNSDAIITPSHGPNAGQLCFIFSTSSNTYHGRVSDLAAAVVAWASLSTTNYLIPPRFITPVVTAVTYASSVDKLVALGSPDLIVIKQLVSSQFDFVMGVSHRQSLEAGAYVNQPLAPFGGQTVTNLESQNGWLLGMLTTAAQRGIVCTCLLADSRFDNQYIITKVLSTNDFANFKQISIIRQLNKYTSTPKIQYRTSGFGSQTGGWLDWPENLDGSAVAPGTQLQFKIQFRNYDEFITNTAQIEELYLGYVDKTEISEFWEGSVDNSTPAGISPTRSAFRLRKVYPTSVPTLYYRAYDNAGNLVVAANTVTNQANFEYSTNNGATWNALGTIPNTALTTEIRYNHTSPPGVEITNTLRES